jgi:hypothetical protein
MNNTSGSFKFFNNTPNVGKSNFIKGTLLDIKAQMGPNIIIGSDLTTPLSPIIDR